ncbi:MAG: excinuclease ABC subunit A, partial [Planctomycetaceae bacterium]|nr:excinuclease ABC subunit A [Planctomycetaceae bacterium]
NWNDQASVEITAKKKTGAGWFLHALTGDEWLLRFYFRVPKGTFSESDLQKRIALKSVNDLDELQIYNRAERVRVNEKKGPFQEVVLDVHWKEEIDTPEFRTFLDDAVAAYLRQTEKKADTGDALMPWKVLKAKWHTMRKGFPSNKRVAWNAAVAEKLIEGLEETFSELETDWSNKTRISWKDSEGTTIADLQTKRRDALYLSLYSAPGAVALGQIADLGKDREILPHRSGQEELRFQITAQAQITPLLRFVRDWS